MKRTKTKTKGRKKKAKKSQQQTQQKSIGTSIDIQTSADDENPKENDITNICEAEHPTCTETNKEQSAIAENVLLEIQSSSNDSNEQCNGN